MKTVAQQQGVFDIDFVEQFMRAFCGSDFDAVFDRFIGMLVFDALIGSMDRHARNWGVLAPETKDSGEALGRVRFSPIYDSARALLWDLSDAKIKSLSASDINKYIEKSSPASASLTSNAVVTTSSYFRAWSQNTKIYLSTTYKNCHFPQWDWHQTY